MQQFILTVEGPNLQDLEEVELPALPQAGDPIETRFGTCLVVRTETAGEDSTYDGRIFCRLP